MLSSRNTPRAAGRSPRRETASERLPTHPRVWGSSTASGTRNGRAASVASVGTARATIGSPRAAPGALRTASDVFEVVADGNAEMLTEMMEFSGAKHLCELRSKRQEDYGRNLLHCAVANGQLRTLQVLLQHSVFDPNQVDSVYTRSTPMMEAVKIGQLDLIECLIRAGGRLDVQDVNGDTVLHWSAREVSAAFLRQVLQLARKHGANTADLMAALQMTNNSGETAADVGANELARESIQRIISGEETPGMPPKKSRSMTLRASVAASAAGASPFLSQTKTSASRPRSATAIAPTATYEESGSSTGHSVASMVVLPAGVAARVVAGVVSTSKEGPTEPLFAGREDNEGVGKMPLSPPAEVALLPKLKGVASQATTEGGNPPVNKNARG